MEFQSLFMQLFPILPSNLHGPLLLLFPFLSLPLTHIIKSINLSCPLPTLSKKPPSLRMEKRLWKLSWPRIFSSGKAGMVGRVGARVLEHCCIPFLSFPFSLSSPPLFFLLFFLLSMLYITCSQLIYSVNGSSCLLTTPFSLSRSF